MKDLATKLIAVFAIIVGFTLSSCTPDTTEPANNATVKEVSVDHPTPNGAEVIVLTKNIKEFTYVINKDIDAAAIMKAGADNMKTISDTEASTTTTVSIRGLEPDTAYTAYFAFRKADDFLCQDIVKLEFTTTSYGEDVVTVTNIKYDGFDVYVQIPEEVKARGNALRYASTSLPMYNYAKMEDNIEISMLLYNAGCFMTEDGYVRYDEFHSYERDDKGNIVEGGAEYADPKVPGEPGIFLIGEYSYMDNEEERIAYIDGEIVTGYDDSYNPYTIWTYPAGWKPGYYRPEYDFKRFMEEAGTENFDSEKYWTGYYEKLFVETLKPETLEGNVSIKVTDRTPIDACVTFEATEDVVFYNFLICTEDEYQTQILPLLDYNEEYLRWFVGSYFAMMSFGVDRSMDMHSEMWLKDWFNDTKGYAGQQFRVLVAGLGDQNGKTQCFNTATFTLPEVTLPKPEVVVTPIKSDDPFTVSFNIKNPNYADNPITEAYFACNYVREYNTILKEYSYTDLLKSMGNAFTNSDIEKINTEAGFTFTVSSRDNETTRLAVLAYNWEGSGNNPDKQDSPAVAENTTPNANFPARVNSPLFEELVGEWTAAAPMAEFTQETDDEGNATGKYIKKEVGTYTSDVTISAGVEYPETLSQDVYDLYASAGFSKEATDDYYDEFKEIAQWYNVRTRGYNRLLCMGYNFAAEDYMLDVVATPYDLFTAKDYSVSQVSYIFYDFGPKWNLEIDADGNVWLPINIEREYPLEAFNFGLDYTFYLLAVSASNTFYFGTPIYSNTGKLLVDSRFPVEVSEDRNTITIKPIIYNYTDDNGNPVSEKCYPCVAQLQYNMATPVNPRVNGDVVLTRKSGSTRAAANPSVRATTQAPVESLGEAPTPMVRANSMTPFTLDDSKMIKHHVREQKLDNSPEAYHARVRAMFKQMYGIDFPAK